MPAFRSGALIAGVLLISGCAGGALGRLGDVLGTLGGGAGGTQQEQGQVQAEVQQVDTRNQRIQIRTQQGESGSVRFDQRTEVIYRQQRYDVTALERGDIVNIQLVQSGNEYYAARIDVVQSVQERTGDGG